VNQLDKALEILMSNMRLSISQLKEIMSKKSDKSAFGLIETLIACAVLIIVIGALMTLNVIITNSIIFSKQRAVAYNLAQSAVESAIEIRDSNYIDGNDATGWNSLICDAGSSSARVPDLSGVTIYKIAVGNLCQSSEQRYFRYFLLPNPDSTGENIGIGGQTYQRKITFASSGVYPPVKDSAGNDVTDVNTLRIIVTVNWKMNGHDKNVELRQVLTNWRQGL